ncbi:MAG TPA: HAD-IIA family hydrolase [Mycobacteriales bacterium]|nr:HAD-IIA family hydrolase [Mycobacteriales bacterium]
MSDEPPARTYDVALLDLDGVVYLGSDVIDGVPAALERAREAGMRLAFVTNNASRTPAAVAEMLSGMGVAATPDEVTTSAQAACHVLADKLPAGAKVLVVGTTGLIEAARERGFTLVDSADDEPAAVVQGYGPNVGWKDLAEATVAVRRGAWYVATNLDSTVPSARGALPGNGSLVGVVRATTGVTPTSTGKPDPAMHRESVQRSGAQRPIVVGDRLDTDIEGASRAGCDSMLVLTGVTTAADLLAAGPEHRPTYVARSVAGLLEPQPAPVRAGADWTCGGWTVSPGGRLSGAGDDLDALRALCAAAWAGGGTDVTPDGADATETARRLGL